MIISLWGFKHTGNYCMWHAYNNTTISKEQCPKKGRRKAFILSAGSVAASLGNAKVLFHITCMF